MCIALPNAEGSFTVTLFLPNHGSNPADPSFATVDSPAAARALFERDFADALPLIPDLQADFAANPVGMLATLYLERWHIDLNALMRKPGAREFRFLLRAVRAPARRIRKLKRRYVQ